MRQRYNVAPGDEVLAVTTDREGAPRGELLRWGLVPSWAKSPNTGLKMINARLETVGERPGVPACVRALPLPDRRRRLLRVAAEADATAPKQPFHITRDDGGAVRVRRAVVDLARATTATSCGPARS